MVSSSPSLLFMTAKDCLRLAIIIMSGLAAATLVFVFLDMVIKPLVINDVEAAATTTAANINLAFAQEISSEHQPTQAEKITKNVVVVESKTPTGAINRSSISNSTITPFNTCYRELDNQQQIYKSCAILDLLHYTAFCDSEYTCVKSESYSIHQSIRMEPIIILEIVSITITTAAHSLLGYNWSDNLSIGITAVLT